MLKDAALVLVLVALTGCRTGRNYSGLEGPRYTGGSAATVLRPDVSQRLRVVSFNIAFARQVEAAIAVLESDPAVGEADVILLQEMDEAGTRRVAHAFGMAYVYYPGTFHLRTRRDFGNAVLSRWPILWPTEEGPARPASGGGTTSSSRASAAHRTTVPARCLMCVVPAIIDLCGRLPLLSSSGHGRRARRTVRRS